MSESSLIRTIAVVLTWPLLTDGTRPRAITLILLASCSQLPTMREKSAPAGGGLGAAAGMAIGYYPHDSPKDGERTQEIRSASTGYYQSHESCRLT